MSPRGVQGHREGGPRHLQRRRLHGGGPRHIHTHTYTYIYIYIHIHIRMHVHIHVHVHMCIYMHTPIPSLYICIYMYTYACVHVCIYMYALCMYVCRMASFRSHTHSCKLHCIYGLLIKIQLQYDLSSEVAGKQSNLGAKCLVLTHNTT